MPLVKFIPRVGVFFLDDNRNGIVFVMSFLDDSCVEMQLTLQIELIINLADFIYSNNFQWTSWDFLHVR
jgi:hypothetical protein